MSKTSLFNIGPERLNRLLSIGKEKLDAGDSPGAEYLTEQAGGWIGKYKLIRKLGEGGMGVVYLAQQQHPIKREVAIKVIKLGMDTKRVIVRFEAERQALALLDHPNIAHVYDAGTTEAGRPYFAMEFVEGMPITDYCDQHKLTIKERLSLFKQVCQAVQHAHQKGIIHRDIKPSNILVSGRDGEAIPKIIDFGVAKAVDEPLTELTLKTEDSHLLGTPEYMSPEQADMVGKDIDTRSDVYSLGVLLYVLLTGVLPFDSRTLRDSGIENIRRMIREIDPKTPSTRLISLGEEAGKVAEQRSTEISTLAKYLKNELEWIPLKAMQKERSERYRSASQLGDDIKNYLRGTPLIAGPPTSRYRIKKFIRRHKSLVAGVIAVLVVLTAGITVSSVFALKAQRRAQGLVSFVDFLTLDVLGSARDIKGRDATVIDVIDAARAKLETGEFKNQPMTAESLLRFRLGNLVKDLGYPNKAIPHLERVREIYLENGITPPSTGASHSGASRHLIMNYLALAYLRSGELEKAEAIFQQIIEEKEETNDLYTALYPWVKARLAETYREQAQYTESERVLVEMMDPQFRNGEGLSQTSMIRCMRDLAETYRGQGRYQEAEQMYIKVEKMGEWAPLRKLYMDTGRYRQAEERLRAEIERSPLTRPGKNPIPLIGAKNDLAIVLTKQGKFEEAERLFEEVLKVRKERWFDDHPYTLTTINDFGVLRCEQKKYAEAELLLRQALTGRRRKLGAGHFTCFDSMHELAVLYKEQGDYDKAEPLLLEALEGRRLKLGDTHPHTQQSWNNLIALYEAWNKLEEAERWRAKPPSDGTTNGQSQNASGR